MASISNDLSLLSGTQTFFQKKPEPIVLPAKSLNAMRAASSNTNKITPNSFKMMTAFAKPTHAPFLAEYRQRRDVLNAAVENFKDKMTVYKGFTSTPESM